MHICLNLETRKGATQKQARARKEQRSPPTSTPVLPLKEGLENLLQIVASLSTCLLITLLKVSAHVHH